METFQNSLLLFRVLIKYSSEGCLWIWVWLHGSEFRRVWYCKTLTKTSHRPSSQLCLLKNTVLYVVDPSALFVCKICNKTLFDLTASHSASAKSFWEFPIGRSAFLKCCFLSLQCWKRLRVRDITETFLVPHTWTREYVYLWDPLQAPVHPGSGMVLVVTPSLNCYHVCLLE